MYIVPLILIFLNVYWTVKEFAFEFIPLLSICYKQAEFNLVLNGLLLIVANGTWGKNKTNKNLLSHPEYQIHPVSQEGFHLWSMSLMNWHIKLGAIVAEIWLSTSSWLYYIWDHILLNPSIPPNQQDFFISKNDMFAATCTRAPWTSGPLTNVATACESGLVYGKKIKNDRRRSIRFIPI